MQYSIETRIRDNPILRSSFNALAEETFGLRLVSIHNLHFLLDFARRMREAIEQGRFQEFRRDFWDNWEEKDARPADL